MAENINKLGFLTEIADNPKMKSKSEIEKIIEEIRPNLVAHGGNVELVEVDPKTGIVSVRLEGKCVGCPLANITLKLGIEKQLKEKAPWVKEVVDLTEHDFGEFDED